MKLAYEAFDNSGKKLRGTVEAASPLEATEALRRQGLYVATIGQASMVEGSPLIGSGTASPSVRMGTGRKLKNLAMFTRQLAVLVSSGTALVDALGALERQSKDVAWRQIVTSLRTKVEEGMPLSEAMAAYPNIFDAVARSLVAAGEAGGIFDVMLDRLAVLSKKSLHVRQAIVGALIYPTLLILLSINVLCLMLLFVLPKFTGLFESLDAPLPSTTQMLMHLSDGLRVYWWGVLLFVGGSVVGLRYWVRTPSGRRVFHGFLVNAPFLKNVTRSFAIARVTRVLGTLLNGRVPMLEALALARLSCSNVHFAELVARAEDAVTRGAPMSSAFAECELVAPSIVEAMRSGEASGQVATLMLNISDFLDEENEVVVKSLTSILEPVILIGLGILVGFIAISMFLPLFDLTSAAQSGGH